MRHTKLDMARVIVTAFCNCEKLVAADHPEVVRRAAEGTVANLTYQYKLAQTIVASAQQAISTAFDPALTDDAEPPMEGNGREPEFPPDGSGVWLHGTYTFNDLIRIAQDRRLKP